LHEVSIEDQGRCGTVTYDEGGGRRLSGYWEFGGSGDVVADVRLGTIEEWARYPWALPRRAEILQAVADEVVRQKAPSCQAEIDQAAGAIVLRSSGAAGLYSPPPVVAVARPRLAGGVTAATRAEEARWVFRLSTLRAKLGLVVLVAAVLLGAGLWLRDTLFAIDPGKGTAIGDTVRTDTHVATLIQNLEPYVPTLDHNHGNDRYCISLFLVPLDGSAPQLILLRENLEASVTGTARIFGVDGRTLWFNVAGIGGVDLADYSLLPEAEAAKVDPRSLPRPWGDWPVAPRLERLLEAVTGTEILDAARLRSGPNSGPVRFSDPPGSLVLFTSASGPEGTAVVARIDDSGNTIWRVDTGISRFGLQQILPGEHNTALVGPRPAVPGKVSEPLLVIVDHSTGKAATHSLWQ
jgi:hypothetical protein